MKSWIRCGFPRALIAVSGALLVASAARAASPLLEKIDLFQNGDGGYTHYRIPGIVVTKSGVVLAYCEGRKTSGADWDTIEIVMRRSTDEGRTWESAKKIAHYGPVVPRNPVAIERKQATPEDHTVNDPAAIADHTTGAVHFIYCCEYDRCFYMRSDDDGVTFSKPVDITYCFDEFHSEYPWRVIATGPDHGIELKSGRLVLPVWLALGTQHTGHKPSLTATIYSDDHGKTWHRGAIAVPNTDKWNNPNETVVVQLADGRVMLNSRTLSPEHRRVVTIGPDGRAGWSEPKFDQALLDPFCMASIVRYSEASTGGRNRLLFANPNSLVRPKAAPKGPDPQDLRERQNVSIKMSYDEGSTWPVNKTLEPGWSSYSDLAVCKSGTALCFYERAAQSGEDSGHNSRKRGILTIARFNLEWLTDGQDSYSP